MMAASAEMGHRFTAFPAVMSTLTSSPPWQTHMYLSLCSEQVPNLIDSGATPAVWTSCFFPRENYVVKVNGIKKGR